MAASFYWIHRKKLKPIFGFRLLWLSYTVQGFFAAFFCCPVKKSRKKTAPNQDLLQTILAKPKHPLKQSHVALCPCSEKGFVAICNKNWLPLTFGSYKAILRHFKNHLLMIALNFVFLLLPLPAMFKKGFCIYERGFLC